MVSNYHELKVYQRAYQIALDIHTFSLSLPKIEQYALADQIRRASKSICANIAEGFVRHHSSKAEFKRFLMIALGSSEEMRVWLTFCKDLKYVDAKDWDKWDKEYNEISKMIFSLHKNWKD